MELLESAVLQARLWKTSMRLGASDFGERLKAIENLSQAGPAAIPCLRFHLLREFTRRPQFAAAIALHRLNAPEGMATLLSALDRPLNVFADIAPLLEEAFLLAGSPAAGIALQTRWATLPEWQNAADLPPDASARVRMICRVWAGLQDPTALDTLLEYSTRIPDLFPPTAAAFGQMAVRKLRDAAQSADPFQRLLIIRTLERIPGEASFRALAPLLRDPSPPVRVEACRALAGVGTPHATSEAVMQSILAGYSSEASVYLLAATGHPRLHDTLRQLIERAPALCQTMHDTPGAVHAALDLLVKSPLPPDTRLRIVCTLLEKSVPAEIMLAGIAHVTALQGCCPRQTAYVQGVLWNLLADFGPRVRAQAAQTLMVWGDMDAKRFLDLLAECRPQGSFLEKLTTLLRGGPDASQAATQAVQQIQLWVTRLSREAIVRLSSPTLSREPTQAAAPQNPRFPALTRKLLGSALQYLNSAQSLEETEEALALSITAIRTLRRLGVSAGLAAQTELHRALYACKPILTADGRTAEIGEPVREEAALALIEFLGTETFALFVSALEAPRFEIRGTAILALGRLGDARAVPYLQPIAADTNSLSAPYAVQALAVIRQNNPEMMTLLRGSSQQDLQPETLLRPLAFSRPDTAPELLLRPTSNGESNP